MTDPAELPPAVARARSVDGLLAALMASDPGRPRLTWYGPGDERVELSARVLANWVAKTGNLLVEECDVEPGSLVQVDLPPHWRTIVVALAAWSVGASVAEASADDEEPVDVLVTAAPPDDGADASVVAVALPALARRFDGHGKFDVDYAAEVTGFADEPLYAVDDDPAEALAAARAVEGVTSWPAAARVLIGPQRWLTPHSVLAALALDGSVVLVGDPAADLDRIAETEQVTATL